MSKKSGAELLRAACVRNQHHKLLERYLLFCRPESEDNEPSVRRGTSKKQKRDEGLFPNLAGFCRFLRMGTEDFSEVAKEFPDAAAYIVTALEDEALNAAISPTLLNAYLKRRLGYDREELREEPLPSEPLPLIRFEHDILRDGE